ncbi:RNA methyltransferase [Segnochrobactraceae bacterium EtOH-i3]
MTETAPDLVNFPPSVVLVEPQLGENIGTACRAMANFGLADLRLVAPRDGWPNERAIAAASRADHVLNAVQVFDTFEGALTDFTYVLATTARARDFAKPVLGPEEAVAEILARTARGEKVGILFGRERVGLHNEEIAVADAILTYPIDPRFASLNIAQAVLLIAYEWRRQASRSAIPFTGVEGGPPATKEALTGLFEHLEHALEDADYFKSDSFRPVMVRTIRNMFTKASLTHQDVQILRGIIAALEGRPTRPRRLRGPARTPKAGAPEPSDTSDSSDPA